MFTLCAALPSAATDELRLRSGAVIRGEFIAGDINTIVFRVDNLLQMFRKAECLSITINFGGAAPAPGTATLVPGLGTPTTGAADPAPPPEFTARAPLRITRVVALKRLTKNRTVEDGRFEPEFARISDNGAVVAFFAPKSGLYLMDADGGNSRLVISTAGRDNAALEGPRFALSPDGKFVFWQPGQSRAIYRINADGTDERLLVRGGGEYEPNRLRAGGGRIFFSTRGGIFSIDTAGDGDYHEIIVPRQLAREWECPEEWCMLGAFDASEDGKRIVFSVGGYPKAKARQLMAINADGAGLRRIVETDFDPQAIAIAPDGNRVVFWKNTEKAFTVNWDGTGLAEIAIPPWDGNGGGYIHMNRISPDGQWYEYNANEAGGFSQVTRLDGSGRYELQQYGPWDGLDTALFHGMYAPAFSADLRRFVAVSQYWRGFKPRQIVVGTVNPAATDGLPVVTDITFPPTMSTNEMLPNNEGKVTARIRGGSSVIERVQFLVSPCCQRRGDRWVPNAGVIALRGDRLMRDDGKNGDAAAGDGLYTGTLALLSGDWKLPPGRYTLRLVIHDEDNAVAVDVDGFEVK